MEYSTAILLCSFQYYFPFLCSSVFAIVPFPGLSVRSVLSVPLSVLISVCPCLSLSVSVRSSVLLSRFPFLFFRSSLLAAIHFLQFFVSWNIPFFLAIFNFWLIYAVFYYLQIFLKKSKKSVDKREILYYNRHCQQDMKTADNGFISHKKEFEKILKSYWQAVYRLL